MVDDLLLTFPEWTFAYRRTIHDDGEEKKAREEYIDAKLGLEAQLSKLLKDGYVKPSDRPPKLTLDDALKLYDEKGIMGVVDAVKEAYAGFVKLAEKQDFPEVQQYPPEMALIRFISDLKENNWHKIER